MAYSQYTDIYKLQNATIVTQFFPFEKASDVKIHTCQIIEAHLFHCKHCNNDYNKRELLEEHIYSGASCSKLGERDQSFIGKFSLLDFGI